LFYKKKSKAFTAIKSFKTNLENEIRAIVIYMNNKVHTDKEKEENMNYFEQNEEQKVRACMNKKSSILTRCGNYMCGSMSLFSLLNE